ncbi:hypothetical protein Gasu2_57890 [Galdieria sulphuraria]|nr:hypothetical protein Gasu2_57890 [Galdieria sulphuraria]
MTLSIHPNPGAVGLFTTLSETAEKTEKPDVQVENMGEEPRSKTAILCTERDPEDSPPLILCDPLSASEVAPLWNEKALRKDNPSLLLEIA